MGASQPALVTLAIDRARFEERGSALSTIWAAVDGGIAIGTLANGFILESSGFAAMFGVNAIMPLLGTIGFLVLDRRRRFRRQTSSTK